MRIPGVKSIAWCPVTSVPDTFEPQALAGIAISVVGIPFTGLSIIGEPQLDLSDSNENNGSNQKVTLSFVTCTKFSSKRAAFIVTCNNGAKYLIGSQSAVPAISTKDTTSAPSAANHFEVQVELSAALAWVVIEGQEAYQDGDYIRYEYWQPKADERYAQKQHRHPSSEVDDAPSEQTQEQNNIDQGKNVQEAKDWAVVGWVL